MKLNNHGIEYKTHYILKLGFLMNFYSFTCAFNSINIIVEFVYLGNKVMLNQTGQTKEVLSFLGMHDVVSNSP